MFFPDPLAAMREILRVLQPAGTLSLVVWYKSEANPFSFCVSEVVSRLIPASDSPAPTQDAFCFAEPGKLAGLLKEAGANNVRERRLKFDIAAPISPEEFWAMRSETSGTLREKLASVSHKTRQRVREEVLRAANKYFPEGQMKFPAQMLIVSGNKRR
jgi:SAM-dependent methyltransferase